jgi:hypothetical protein
MDCSFSFGVPFSILPSTASVPAPAFLGHLIRHLIDARRRPPQWISRSALCRDESHRRMSDRPRVDKLGERVRIGCSLRGLEASKGAAGWTTIRGEVSCALNFWQMRGCRSIHKSFQNKPGIGQLHRLANQKTVLQAYRLESSRPCCCFGLV